MSFLYYTKKDFVPLPGRTVQTFPSGLVRVERSFACRKRDAEIYRNRIKVGDPMPEDDGAPAIDGLYIFPEPQEVDRGDGFVEFRVTAYGTTGVVPPPEITAVKDFVIETVRTITVDEDGRFVSQSFSSNAFRSLNEVYTYRRVVIAGESLDSLITPPNISPRIFIQANTAATGRRITPQISVLAENFSSTNFGFWNEWVFSYKAYGFIFSTFVNKQ